MPRNRSPKTRLQIKAQEIANKEKRDKDAKTKNKSSVSNVARHRSGNKKLKKRGRSIPNLEDDHFLTLELSKLEKSLSLINLKDESYVDKLFPPVPKKKDKLKAKQKSHESFQRKTSQEKTLESFLSKKRFSQGEMQDILQGLIDEEDNNDEEEEQIPKKSITWGEEPVKIVKDSEIKSLTGANASGWKFADSTEYGNFNQGRRPSMNTGWGRRIYDQYEIDVEVDKPKYGHKSRKTATKSIQSMSKKQAMKDLGVWDVIFDKEIVPVLQGVKKWEADHEDKQKALKKLNVDETIIEDEVIVPDKADPVGQFALKFCKTGSYLKPYDLQFCLQRTSFTEDQIIDWFKRFRTDCPNGRLTMDVLIKIFKKAFPDGDGHEFSKHIVRIFDCDGNGFLDFKEFLMALDVATCNSEESRLEWVFKLYDVDNNGFIDVKEMAKIMETMECLEYKKGSVSGTVDELSPIERAQNLFNCMEHEYEGSLSKEEFIAGYLERNTLMEKQDAQEQKLRLDSLIFRGPLIPEPGELKNDELIEFVQGLIKQRCCGLTIDPVEDLAHVQLREASENYPKSLLIKFSKNDLRNEIWSMKQACKKNSLIIEEWLTENRARIFKRCKQLKSQKMIKDCYTNNGEIFVKINKDEEYLTLTTEGDYDELFKSLRLSNEEEENEQNDVFE